jgi:hypothetical protein
MPKTVDAVFFDILYLSFCGGFLRLYYMAPVGTDIPRVHQKDKMPHEGPVGPIIRKVIPLWAWGGTSNKPDRRKPRRPDEFER